MSRKERAWHENSMNGTQITHDQQIALNTFLTTVDTTEAVELQNANSIYVSFLLIQMK